MEDKGSGERKTRKKLAVASLFTGSSLSSSSFPALDPQASLLVRVLHLRAAFGGMPCDVAMMRGAAETWLRRFAGRGGVPPSTGAAEANKAPARQQQAPLPGPCESWLNFLWRSFSPPLVPPLTLPPGATAATAVGRLSQEDIVLSSVDFHVSSISEELMKLPAVAREARKAARAAGEMHGNGDEAAEERLRRAMWLFRSGRNVRSSPLRGGGSGSSSAAPSASTLTSAAAPAAPSAAAAPVVLNGDSARAGALRAQAAAERDDLRPLWRAAAAAADSWSSEFLRQRFGARGGFDDSPPPHFFLRRLLLLLLPLPLLRFFPPAPSRSCNSSVNLFPCKKRERK